MNSVQQMEEPRLIKRETYNAFDRIHQAMCRVLEKEGRVKIVE